MFPSSSLMSVGVIPDHIRNWALALSASTGVSFEIALLTLLSGMASATCGLKVIKRPDGGFEQTSLIVFVHAPPAYGKTRAYKRAFKAHQAVDASRLLKFIDGNNSQKSNCSADMAAEKRNRLRLSNLQDASKFGLLEALQGVGEAVSMTTHEGNLILNSNLFRNDGLEMITTLWDGEGTIQINRGRGNILVAIGGTLNMLVMVQDDVSKAYRARRGDHARSIGLFGRSLFVNAPMWGNQLGCPIEADERCLTSYDERVELFLTNKLSKLLGNKQLQSGESGVCEASAAHVMDHQTRLEPEVLELTPEAAQVYFDLEKQLHFTWGRHGHMQDAVGRSMQNVLRMAGSMQAFDDDQAPISVQVLRAGYHVVEYCLGQFNVVFPPEPIKFMPIKPIKLKPIRVSSLQRSLQRGLEDGQTIINVVFSLCQLRKEASVPLSDVRERCVIYPLRFRAALAKLIDAGQVLLTGAGKDVQISVVPATPGDVASQLGYENQRLMNW